MLLVSPLLTFDLLGGRSRCSGSVNDGGLAGAVRPPLWGESFRSYCYLCAFALRTYGHEAVVESLLEAYATLARSHPETRFVYGEIGFPWGGRFPPHRSHRNGLSVDFMVPLAEGRTLPTSLWNRFGYDEDFAADGSGPAGRIDFDALAAHLLALSDAAEARGGRIARVFLAPDLQQPLFAAAGGREVARRIAFNRSPSWVRHDDHYHVDFAFACG